MTHILLALLIASVASVVIQACDDGKRFGNSACAHAAEAFEAAPSDATAQVVRQTCHLPPF